jgi:hypothetical protein
MEGALGAQFFILLKTHFMNSRPIGGFMIMKRSS